MAVLYKPGHYDIIYRKEDAQDRPLILEYDTLIPKIIPSPPRNIDTFGFGIEPSPKKNLDQQIAKPIPQQDDHPHQNQANIDVSNPSAQENAPLIRHHQDENRCFSWENFYWGLGGLVIGGLIGYFVFKLSSS